MRMLIYPEQYRIPAVSRKGEDGAFRLPPLKPSKLWLTAIASTGMDWEHVSVSTKSRCPTWREMEYARELFWNPEAWVVQYSPPRSKRIDNYPYCLHMWRPLNAEFPVPPGEMV